MSQNGARARATRMSARDDLTELLLSARDGERVALDRLFARVYEELRILAHHQIAACGSTDTLNTTALVHEAYIKLVDRSRTGYRDRRHFFALAARAMRQIIIDHARRAKARKRGGGVVRVALDASEVPEGADDGIDAAELLALDGALDALARLSERLVRIVELRYFAGLSVEETGVVLDLSPRTVKRDWQKARAYLFQALHGAAAP
jgi:RNA polymerase sigma factor (TIGR02999 family)